ncbi:MAG: hypothetical protein IPL61_18340 [Myxococcales bacterium]|nr:hypothetical protein [Myxococcales bacterium]
MLAWTAHPARRRPDHVALLAAVVLLSAWAVLVTLEAPWLAALAAALLVIAVAPFWLPTTYRLDDAGIEERRWPRRRYRTWAELRRLDVGARALLLSPFARATWLDRYRGMIVMFDGGDRDAIVAAARARLPAVAGD